MRNTSELTSLTSLAAITIFWGSWLLFGMQPMLGRTLLPSFGGTASVWIICLCAYQVLLLIGYFYAHTLSRLKLNMQAKLHRALLFVAVIWSILFVGYRHELSLWIGHTSQPALEILLCVILFAGLPYTLLSANSSLVQSWLSSRHGNTVYKLYAVSNIGSLCGLLFYPLILEPYTSLTTQWILFAFGLAIYTFFVAVIGGRVQVSSGSLPPIKRDSNHESVNQPRISHEILWITLPAVSCFSLNAITEHITLDVMPFPLLWAILLAAFLLSYVTGFSGHIKKWMPLFGCLSFLCLILALVMLNIPTGGETVFWGTLIAGVGLCYAGCSFIHGWLYLLRPEKEYLTNFYFFNALGGAIGGITASILCPLFSTWIIEYPLCLALFVLLLCCYQLFRMIATGNLIPKILFIPALLVISVLSIRTVIEHHSNKVAHPVYRDRGFFGTIQVGRRQAAFGNQMGYIYDFVHGTTVHGVQIQIPGKSRVPTAYFTEDSGGLAICQHPNFKSGKPLRVGILGLGIGVLVSYSRTNDFYRCYEISPEAMYCATNIFTFIKESPAHIELIPGDARKSMENEIKAKDKPFDILYVDAFTGDNLPYHLSTKEAFELYFKRLKPDGILAVNISNWHLNLAPLMRCVSEHFDIPVVAIQQLGNLPKIRFGSAWAFFMRNPPDNFEFPQDARFINLEAVKAFPLPTDEKGSFISLIQW